MLVVILKYTSQNCKWKVVNTSNIGSNFVLCLRFSWDFDDDDELVVYIDVIVLKNKTMSIPASTIYLLTFNKKCNRDKIHLQLQ